LYSGLDKVQLLTTQLEAERGRLRADYVRRGLINDGQTALDGAIDLRGECEGMCTEYEMEFREFTKEIHPFEQVRSFGIRPSSS
jgi:hypothetical protein